jgi:hypothetical protein
MPTDVIIDPSTGQIYWNDSAVSAQSISIKGDAQNTISIVGYSGSFSPGSAPGGATTLATFTDNSGTDALIPGTNGYDLGKDTARWRLFATSGAFSGEVNIASTTQSTSLLSGAIKIQGGLAVSSNASIGQTLFFYNPSNALFTAFRAGAAAASTTYTLPTNSPQSSVGTSVLSSTIAGVMSWVPLASSGSGSSEVYTGALYDVAYFAAAGATVQGSSTLINNTASGQVKISHTTASFGTSSGALQVAGGVGISGRLSFNQASFGTTGITTVPTMAMIGQTGDPIFLSVLEDNSIVFEGSQGQLFSISPNLSTGYIWAVNDISGIPLLRANVSGNVFINEFGGLVGLGHTNPAYKFHVRGSSAFATTNGASAISFLFDNISAPGSNTFQIKSANSIQLYNSADTFYTALKSNASTNVTYTLPATDGSNGQALTTNGSATLSWTTISGGSGGGGTGVQPGGEFEIAYYASTGSSVVGSSTFKNDTTAAKVSVTHTTSSISSSTGAFVVSGGVGIGGSLWVSGIGASISGVRLSHSIAYGSFVGNVTGNVSGTVTGNVSGTVTGNVQGNVTGNVSGSLTGNVTGLATTSNNIQVAIGAENLSHTLLFTRPTSTVSGSGGIAVSNDLTLFFNPSTEILSVSGLAVTSSVNSTSTTTGALNITGGASVGQSLSIGGRLQLFNTSLSTAFVSAQSGVNTTYTLPATSPTATGTSVLSSTMAGVMSWVPLASGGSGSGVVNAGTANFAAFYATSSAAVSENANLQFTGTGVSIGGNITSISTATGSLKVSGGLGLSGNAFIGGTVTIQDSTVSASTTTGALVVAGGIGVGGKVFADVLQSSGNAAVGGNLTVAGTVDLGNAVADTISFLGRVDTDIDPIATNTYDLGDSSLVWKNVSIGSSVIFYNTSNANTLGFRAGASGASLIYTLPIDTPSAGQVLSASAPSGGVVTLSWEDDQTGAPAGGITTLNTLTAATQSFQTGTTGTDFAISSATSTHTFNLPDASATARGVITTGTQTIAGSKTFSSAILGNVSGNVTGNVSGNLTGNVVGIAITAGSTHVSIASAATAHAITVVPTTSAQVTVGIGQSIVSGVTVLASTGVITAGGFSGNVTGTVSGNVTGTVSGNVTGSVSGSVTGGVSGNVTGNVVGIAITSGSTHVSIASAATAHAITVVPTTSAQVTVGIGQSIVSGVTVLASTGVITAGGFSGNVTGNVSGTVTGNVQGNVTGNVSGSVTGNVTGLATTSYNVQVAIGSENLSHTLLFTRPSSTVSGSGGIAVSQDLTLFFNPSSEILSTSGLAVTSTTNSISSTSGALIVTGGASVGQSLSIGGRLQLFNSSLSTAFVSAQAGVNTTYTLPTTSPAATGTSVLSSTMAGVMSWVPLTSTVGGSGTPGGSNKQIQYNNASSFGGASGFEYTTGGIAITVGFFAPSGLGYTSGLWVNAINGSTTRIGIGLSNPQFELEILGELSATNKSFVINHPTKSGLKLRYGSLEGPENGVYVRGELKGTNIIEVPDHWVGLVHEDSYTVHLTPIGKYAQLYVEKIENYNVFVAENNNSYIHCYYSVWAERKDIPKLVTEYEAQ